MDTVIGIMVIVRPGEGLKSVNPDKDYITNPTSEPTEGNNRRQHSGAHKPPFQSPVQTVIVDIYHEAQLPGKDLQTKPCNHGSSGAAASFQWSRNKRQCIIYYFNERHGHL
jgi:hypothetical protein